MNSALALDLPHRAPPGDRNATAPAAARRRCRAGAHLDVPCAARKASGCSTTRSSAPSASTCQRAGSTWPGTMCSSSMAAVREYAGASWRRGTARRRRWSRNRRMPRARCSRRGCAASSIRSPDARAIRSPESPARGAAFLGGAAAKSSIRRCRTTMERDACAPRWSALGGPPTAGPPAGAFALAAAAARLPSGRKLRRVRGNACMAADRAASGCPRRNGTGADGIRRHGLELGRHGDAPAPAANWRAKVFIGISCRLRTWVCLIVSSMSK